MENLLSAGAVELRTVEGIDITKERKHFLLALAVDVILRSLNRVTVTSADRLELQFTFYGIVGSDLHKQSVGCVWIVLLRLFGFSGETEFELLNHRYLSGIRVDANYINGFTVSVPRTLLQAAPHFTEENVKMNIWPKLIGDDTSDHSITDCQ